MKLSLCTVAIGMAALPSAALRAIDCTRSRSNDDSTDPYALPDAPAPPTLPDLTHRALAGSMESGFASIRGNTQPDGTPPWALLRLDRTTRGRASRRHSTMVRRSQRTAGSRKSKGRQFLDGGGQPRGVGARARASQAGLAYGGGLGVVLPAVHHGTEGTDVAEAIRAIRPWDYVDFVNDDFIFRPFIDVRDIDGKVILQLRQGIDWDRYNSSLTSRTTFYIGYRPNELIGLGLEAWEVYLIQAPLRKDDGSAAYAVSPSIRFMTRLLQPAVSFLVPIDRTLFGALDNFWAIRLSIQAVFERR